jgi:iron-sulfur cluster repair protein YtfE (RIC family)
MSLQPKSLAASASISQSVASGQPVNLVDWALAKFGDTRGNAIAELTRLATKVEAHGQHTVFSGRKGRRNWRVRVLTSEAACQ